MKIYNTLTRSIDEFVPQDNSKVGVYTCGPTVYDFQHIGNYATFLRSDLLIRTLESSGYEVNWYMNITDVGHLVSDADTGEDKLEKGAKREGKSAWDVAKFYADDFIENIQKLNIKVNLAHLVKATDHIKEQIGLINILEKKGYTYLIDDGVYFDSTKFPKYGDMARLNIKGQQAGARVDVGQKKNPTDFALWKLSPDGSSRDMEWESPWGKGFPGWHIECSAMSMKYLGDTLDIHGGGIDHIPVHHTNEIAQSEAATDKLFARYWFHSNFLQVDGTKISKSLNNGITIKDLEAKDFNASDFRMFVLQSHYRTEANFTWEGLSAAHSRLVDLQALADLRYQYRPQGIRDPALMKKYKIAITDALQDDLNSPRALAAVSELASSVEVQGISTDISDEFNEFLNCLDDRLGFKLKLSPDISNEEKEQIETREKARLNKDWQQSDEIRDDLLTKGIALKDTPHGTVWYRL